MTKRNHKEGDQEEPEIKSAGDDSMHTPPAEEITDSAQQVPHQEQPINLPDPHPLETVAVGGSRMTLARSRQFQQMQIRFEEKPSAEVTSLLKQEGWKWRGQDTGWTKQLDREARWRGHADAEQLFQDIVEMTRVEKGLDPSIEQGR